MRLFGVPGRALVCLILSGISLPVLVLESSGGNGRQGSPAPKRPGGEAGAAGSPAGITFADVTSASGIRFRHNNGAFGKKYMPETLGPGGAVLSSGARVS